MIPRKLAAAVCACGIALAGTQAHGQRTAVGVEFVEPGRFIDVARPFDAHLEELRRHVVLRAAPLLGPGERLAVSITQLDMAGSEERGRPRTTQARIFREVHPPRIDLAFRLVSVDGNVLKRGERQLTNLAFLGDIETRHAVDPLRYEKALIDAWLEREFAPRRS